jgi:hypothetical protein
MSTLADIMSKLRHNKQTEALLHPASAAEREKVLRLKLEAEAMAKAHEKIEMEKLALEEKKEKMAHARELAKMHEVKTVQAQSKVLSQVRLTAKKGASLLV